MFRLCLVLLISGASHCKKRFLIFFILYYLLVDNNTFSITRLIYVLFEFQKLFCILLIPNEIKVFLEIFHLMCFCYFILDPHPTEGPIKSSLSVCLSFCLSFFLSVCLSVCPSVHLSVCHFSQTWVISFFCVA